MVEYLCACHIFLCRLSHGVGQMAENISGGPCWAETGLRIVGGPMVMYRTIAEYIYRTDTSSHRKRAGCIVSFWQGLGILTSFCS